MGSPVLDLLFDQALLPDGWAADVRVRVRDDMIVEVQPAAPCTVSPETAGHERHAIGLPGMPNLHSHAFQRGMAGLAEVRGPSHDTFWTWREVMYRFALGMNPDDVEAVARQLYIEMLEAGFTRIGEFHYLHHDRDGRPYADPAELAVRIASAADASGIRLTLLPVFYAHGGFGGRPPTIGQRRFLSSPDSFACLVDGARRAAAALPGAVVGIAPHSLRAVTPDELLAILPLAGDGPIHIHAAEQVLEVEECVAWSGQRPVEWLLDHAAADGRWCFIHATHMTPSESRRMGQAGVVAGLCPITEANLGDGIFDGPGFASAGGRFGVGSDSNVLIGVSDELRQLEYAQRLGRRERNIMNRAEGASAGRALFDAALAGGLHALGTVSAAGIAVGAPADFVSLDPTNPALVGRSGDRLLDGWIFAARSSPVDCVWVAGKKLVSGGRHIAREDAARDFARVVGRLIAGDPA